MVLCCSDVCSAPLRFGDWHHKLGCGYDLCCQHRRELSEKEKDEQQASDAQYIEVTSEAQISANSAEFSDYLRNAQLLYEAPSAEGMVMFGEDDGPPDAEGNDSESDSDEDDDDNDDGDEGGGDEEGPGDGGGGDEEGGGGNAAQPPAGFMDLEDFLEGGLEGLHGTHTATDHSPPLLLVDTPCGDPCPAFRTELLVRVQGRCRSWWTWTGWTAGPGRS